MADRSLNVAMFTETFLPHTNGVTTSILNARRGLAKRGHRVQVYSAGAPTLDNDGVHYYGGKTLPLYPEFPVALYPTRAARRNKRLLGQQPPDLVHVHAPGPMGLRGYRAARAHRRPLLVTYHTLTEPLIRYAPTGWKTIYRVGSRAVDYTLNARCTLLVAPTQQAKRYLVARDPHLEPKIRIVPTGIDLDAFRPGLDAARVRRAWGWADGERVLLYLGRVAYEKKIDLLLDAFARLRTSHPELRFVVAGTGPAGGELASRARRLGVEDLVRFTGHVPDEDVPLYYNACDVFASASEFETQGITLLEAMASGASSAVAAAGGFRDVVDDGHNAYLFPPGSVDGAVHAIELALAAPARLRTRARETALRYGIDHCALLLERAYTAAVDGAEDGH